MEKAISGDPQNEAGQLERRRFLGGLLYTAGAMTLTGGLVDGFRTFANADVPSNGIAVLTTASGRTILQPTMAKDGLPALFVAGVLVAVKDGSFVVEIPQRSSQQIEVLYTRGTTVNAGGKPANGALGSCNPGDRLTVGNYLNEAGNRVATYVNANVVVGWVNVTTMTPSGFSGRMKKGPQAEWSFTYADGLDRVPARPPATGEWWHIWATSSAPSSPEIIWAEVMTAAVDRSQLARAAAT